jgi:hypothetical protein
MGMHPQNGLPAVIYNLTGRGGGGNNNLSVMELGHLLTRSGLMYPEVSSKVWDRELIPIVKCHKNVKISFKIG